MNKFCTTKLFVGQGTPYIRLTAAVCVGVTCEKLLLTMCARHTDGEVGERGGGCVCVCGGGRRERGPSRELNSLVLTHIDIKFTAMLSFIQVAMLPLFFLLTFQYFHLATQHFFYTNLPLFLEACQRLIIFSAFV